MEGGGQKRAYLITQRMEQTIPIAGDIGRVESYSLQQWEFVGVAHFVGFWVFLPLPFYCGCGVVFCGIYGWKTGVVGIIILLVHNIIIIS